MIDSRAQDALLFMWSLNIAVLVTKRNGDVWRCECGTESKYGYTGWTMHEASSRELAIEKAAAAAGWKL